MFSIRPFIIAFGTVVRRPGTHRRHTCEFCIPTSDGDTWPAALRLLPCCFPPVFDAFLVSCVRPSSRRCRRCRFICLFYISEFNWFEARRRSKSKKYARRFRGDGERGNLIKIADAHEMHELWTRAPAPRRRPAPVCAVHYFIIRAYRSDFLSPSLPGENSLCAAFSFGLWPQLPGDRGARAFLGPLPLSSAHEMHCAKKKKSNMNKFERWSFGPVLRSSFGRLVAFFRLSFFY